MSLQPQENLQENFQANLRQNTSACQPEASLRVFVYGTLKPGGSGYTQFCAGRVRSQSAVAAGRLYVLPMGYPAMTDEPGWVQGYILEFGDPNLLPLLDDYEDYDPSRPAAGNLYERQWLEVFSPDRRTSLGWAWGYQMRRGQVLKLGGVHLPTGDWPL